MDLPAESVPAVCAAFQLLDTDGEELLELGVKTLQKRLAKSGADDATALAKQVLEQRDALISDDGSAAAETLTAVPIPPPAGAASARDCPICFEHYKNDDSGKLVPRILIGCGHTVCHKCLTGMLTRVNANANGHGKPFGCPSCRKVTVVPKGKAGELPKNFSLM